MGLFKRKKWIDSVALCTGPQKATHSLQDTLIGRLAWFDLSALQGVFFFFLNFVKIVCELGQLRQTILLESQEGKNATLNAEGPR